MTETIVLLAVGAFAIAAGSGLLEKLLSIFDR